MMSDKGKKRLHTISEFEWVSGARYIMYVSSVAGLGEVSSNAIFSFRVGAGGVLTLYKQKVATMNIIERNMDLLARFAGKDVDSFEDAELSIIRGLYRTWKDALDIVKSHVEACRVMGAELADRSLFNLEEGKDEIKF